MLFDDALREGEPETVPGGFLGAEEPLEDAFEVLCSDAMAVVGHDEMNETTPLPQTQSECSTFRKRVESIDDQVRDDLQYPTLMRFGHQTAR